MQADSIGNSSGSSQGRFYSQEELDAMDDHVVIEIPGAAAAAAAATAAASDMAARQRLPPPERAVSLRIADLPALVDRRHQQQRQHQHYSDMEEKPAARGTCHDLTFLRGLELFFLFCIAGFLAAVLFGLFAEGQSLQVAKQQGLHMIERLNSSGIADQAFEAGRKWQLYGNTNKALAAFEDGLKLLGKGNETALVGLNLMQELLAKAQSVQTDNAIALINNYIALGAQAHTDARAQLSDYEQWRKGVQYQLLTQLLSATAVPPTTS